jgi:hypothetical protein
LEQIRGITHDERPYEQAGAVYVYVKVKAIISASDVVTTPQQWLTTETSKIQPPDEFARDYFGAAVAFKGSVLAIGS